MGLFNLLSNGDKKEPAALPPECQKVLMETAKAAIGSGVRPATIANDAKVNAQTDHGLACNIQPPHAVQAIEAIKKGASR